MSRVWFDPCSGAKKKHELSPTPPSDLTTLIVHYYFTKIFDRILDEMIRNIYNINTPPPFWGYIYYLLTYVFMFVLGSPTSVLHYVY